MLQGRMKNLSSRWLIIEAHLVYHKKNLQIELGVLHHLYINGNNTNECHQGSCLLVG